MSKLSTAEKWFDYTSFAQKDLDQYYCAEIFIKELEVIYQYKIWETNSDSLSILIKENSELLDWIKPGDRISIKYYSYDPAHRYHDLQTELIKIEKQTCHRLKGHYLAGLEIIEHQIEDEVLQPYLPKSHTFLTPLPNYNM
jgi:hypothetical protein